MMLVRDALFWRERQAPWQVVMRSDRFKTRRSRRIRVRDRAAAIGGRNATASIGTRTNRREPEVDVETFC